MGGGGATEITRALPMVNAGYVKAKTCVWWDIENCGVPRSCDPYSIARNISKSLADMNYKGVVTISAYGDTTQINSFVQQALSSTGIALNHVPAGTDSGISSNTEVQIASMATSGDSGGVQSDSNQHANLLDPSNAADPSDKPSNE